MADKCTLAIQNFTGKTLAMVGYGDKTSPTRGSAYQMDAWQFGTVFPGHLSTCVAQFFDGSHDEDDSATAFYNLGGLAAFRIDGYSDDHSNHYLQVEMTGDFSTNYYVLGLTSNSTVANAAADQVHWHAIDKDQKGKVFPIGTISSNGQQMGLAVLDLVPALGQAPIAMEYYRAIKQGRLSTIQSDHLHRIVASGGNLTVKGASWMTDAAALLGPLKLNQITMPGSHDAGMYTLTKTTVVEVNACNTETQYAKVDGVAGIGGQLAAGSRFFDMRPTLYPAYSKDIYLGHGSYKNVLYTLYGLGGSVQEALSSVASFMNRPGSEKEVVILKFSHGVTIGTWSTGPFDQGDWEQLIKLVKDTLGDYLYHGSSGTNLGELKFSEIADGMSKRRVIAAFDGLPINLLDQAQGIFSYAGYDENSAKSSSTTVANMKVFDSFSETDGLTKMKDDQNKKIKEYCDASRYLFLASWTLTKPAVGGDCNDVLGPRADFDARTSFSNQVAKGTITRGKIPNIILVDYIHPIHELADLCVYLTMVGQGTVPV